MSRLSTPTPPNMAAKAAVLASKPSRIRQGATPSSKTELVLKKLRSAKGMTLGQLVDLTGWQQHSVRGFLSGTIKKKLGLALVSEAGRDGVRRYRILDEGQAGESCAVRDQGEA